MKDISLSFEVSVALKQTDIHWVEEQLLRIREEIFLEVLKKVIKEIEEEALKGARQCKKCGSPLVRNGQEPRKIRTLIGEVELKRVRLCCKRCGEDLYPLDRAIGLSPRERMTLGVRERALWAAVEVSYSEDR
jgi:RNase P subunit RPR2